MMLMAIITLFVSTHHRHFDDGLSTPVCDSVTADGFHAAGCDFFRPRCYTLTPIYILATIIFAFDMLNAGS